MDMQTVRALLRQRGINRQPIATEEGPLPAPVGSLYVSPSKVVHGPSCRHWQDDGHLMAPKEVRENITDYRVCSLCKPMV